MTVTRIYIYYRCRCDKHNGITQMDTYVAKTTSFARKIAKAQQSRKPRQFPDHKLKPEFSRLVCHREATRKREAGREKRISEPPAGPGLILVSLRGTKHASANLRLSIADAKRFSLSSGAERIHARMLAALIVAIPLESIHSLEYFLSILSCFHPQSNQITITSKCLFPRLPRYR